MDANIDQKLLNCGILDKLKLNSKKYLSVKDSKNLIATFEQYIFVWHDAESCILTTQITNNEVNEKLLQFTNSEPCDLPKDSSYKTLTLTDPPVFEVDSIIFNQTGSLLSLSGKHGVTIYEVPWRYGKFGTTTTNSQSIISRSWNIAELFFIYTNRVQVVQTAWHPGSSSKTHITVLSTDNYIRIYDVNDPQVPEHVISLGSSSRSSFLSSESKIPFSLCFGENAVSFDFGPPENMHIPKHTLTRSINEAETKVVWPVFILQGNGDVYILRTPLNAEKSHSSHKLEGPLAMFPSSEDNYGYDACSILCLHSTPPTVVIASASGIIYHCLVLENSDSLMERKTDSAIPDVVGDECAEALYVFESVELPLTLSEEQDDVYTNSIRLYKDIVSHSKYHCTHISGLHSVAIPFLQALDENADESNLKQVLNDQEKTPCIVEHILCTKPFSQMKAVPVLGLDCSVTDQGIILICLLATWEFVSFSIITSFLPPVPSLLSEGQPKIEDKPLSTTFQQNLEKAMQRSLCSPYIKSFPSSKDINTAPQQWLELLCSVTSRFREDYVQKLTTAHALLKSRIKILAHQKEYQLSDFERCEQEKENLKKRVEYLAEKYEDAQATQQELQKRIENVLKKLQLHLPYLSKAEIEMKQTLLTYEENLKTFEGALDQIKKKLKYQKEKVQEISDNAGKVLSHEEDLKNVSFNETQMKHVKELLSQEGESIAEVMQNVNLLKKQLGLG